MRVKPAAWLVAVLTLVVATLAMALLRPPNGLILASIVVGHTRRIYLPSLSLAVDERTQRIFVNNADDGTLLVLDARSGALLRRLRLGGQQPRDVTAIAAAIYSSPVQVTL